MHARGRWVNGMDGWTDGWMEGGQGWLGGRDSMRTFSFGPRRDPNLTTGEVKGEFGSVEHRDVMLEGRMGVLDVFEEYQRRRGKGG
jgi:hypothetical protein